MRTLKKKINSFINIQKPKEIDLISKKYIEKKGNIILLQEKIETKYFSPITWINLVLHSEIIKHLSIKKNEEIENLVTNEGFIPSRFSSFPAFDQKIKKIPKINAEHLFLIGFYYDEFKCTESFSLGGLYMFIDNLEYSWRLKDQTIFLISLLPGKTCINDILQYFPLVKDLKKLRKRNLFRWKKKSRYCFMFCWRYERIFSSKRYVTAWCITFMLIL
ncbi:hypothetical protein M0812_08282 [Anaeramoeba flamelloides]|uniref:Uncharacterized protein n=1 Tax=Anaeramoeba flamelloides TaxID=1746091 RepID=A0AAV7ZY25_9EUKA|nr:hypothetical protein M0812_08282 [Anaeramoeba flamelloides]